MTKLPMRPTADESQAQNTLPTPRQSEDAEAEAEYGIEPSVNRCLVPVVAPNDPTEEQSRRAFLSNSASVGPHEALSILARMLTASTAYSQTWMIAQWTHLADLSKHEPFWRPLFGPLNRVKSPYRFNQGPNVSTSCILEAAVLAVGHAVTDTLPNEAVRPVLRLIANCCADNNINRSLAINTPLIDWLLILLKRDVEVDVLLPTLYNVCVDYDEPASDPTGLVYRLSDQMEQNDVEVDGTDLSQAEVQLQIWQLLELDEKHYDSCGALLADLLELSSRSALFDISITLAKAQHTEDNGHLERASVLCDLFLSKGSAIASTSTEAQASICQACMNLFSQPVMQRTLSQSPTSLQQFIDLPYLAVIEDDEEVDLSIYREAFLKLMYTISALPDYTISCSPGSALLKALTGRIAKYESSNGFADTPSDPTQERVLSHLPVPPVDDPSPLASVILLINNALTDRTRIDAFLHDHGIVCSQIMVILLLCNNETIILLALKLASRLAISPTGANKIFSSDVHFSIMPRLLNATSSATDQLKQPSGEKPKHTVAIQHELVILVRLINKGQPQITADFIHNEIFTKLLTHSATTIDATFKLETARLCIEILRNLVSPATSATDASAITSRITSPSILPQFISSLIFLLTTSPSATQSEALFGLGIFTSLFIPPSSPHFHPSARLTLLQKFDESNTNEKQVVVKIFRKIAATPQGQETGDTITATATSTNTSGGGGSSSSSSKADYENLKAILTHILLASASGSAAGPASASAGSASASASASGPISGPGSADSEPEAPEKGNDESVDLTLISNELKDIAESMGILKDGMV